MHLYQLGASLYFYLRLSFTNSIFYLLVMYGLFTKSLTDFERPPIYGQKRELRLTRRTFASEGEPYSILLSQIHRSLCLIVRQRSLQNHSPSTDHFSLTSRVPPQEVITMSGIYVDDFLTAGPSLVIRSFLTTLRKMWKTSDPQCLRMDAELPFLSVSIRMTKGGLLLHGKLHQHHYTQDFLCEHSSHVSARKRTTSGEPERFRRELLYHLSLPTLSINKGQDRPKDPRWTTLALYSHSSRPLLLCFFRCTSLDQGHWALESEAATPFTVHQCYSSSWTSFIHTLGIER